MKISMDKKYRTRDGREPRIFCTDGGGLYPVIGLVDGAVVRWDITGVSDGAYSLNLIEYHEPDIRTIWVNVYEDGSVSAYREEFSAQQAFDNNARPHVVIAQPVTFEVKK